MSLVTNAEWKRWGKEDPLWAVSTWPGKERNGPDPWSSEELDALGKSDWSDFRTRWERYGVIKASCLEIGCGVGRITAHLGQDFASVHGVDVSYDMLRRAKQRAPGANLYLTDGVNVPLLDSSVTAVFSCHVLRHLDSPNASVPILCEAFRVLKPGSTMMLHLPLYTWPEHAAWLEHLFSIRQWLARRKAAVERTLGWPLMRGTWYETEWLTKTLRTVGFANIEFMTFCVSSNNSSHSFVLARKPCESIQR